MVSEKMMEDAIAENPEKYLGEKGLKLIARQYSIGSYVFDLLFEDRHGAKLIVELQKGTLDRNHTYKILDYYDEYKEKNPNSFIELMVIANRIPFERRKRLDSKGISWKEIPESEFIDIIVPDNEDYKSNKYLSTNKKQKTQNKQIGGFSSVEALRKAYADYPDKELGKSLQKILDWAISEGIFLTSPGTYPNFRLRSRSNPNQGAVTFLYDGTIQVYFNNILGSAEKNSIFREIMKINPLKAPDDPDHIKRSKDLQQKVQEMSESELDSLLLVIRKYCD